MKIAFVGAGSVVFTKRLLTDILSFPELQDATVALHDIDPERLQTAGMMARWTSERLGAGAISINSTFQVSRCSRLCDRPRTLRVS